jgi:hypothetical protein
MMASEVQSGRREIVTSYVWCQAEYEVVSRPLTAAKGHDADKWHVEGSVPSSPSVFRERPAVNTNASKPVINGVHNSFLEDAVKLRDKRRPSAQVQSKKPYWLGS